MIVVGALVGDTVSSVVAHVGVRVGTELLSHLAFGGSFDDSVGA